jgi:hypothetical protein
MPNINVNDCLVAPDVQYIPEPADPAAWRRGRRGARQLDFLLLARIDAIASRHGARPS